MNTTIRAADHRDAPALAELMILAGDGIPLEVWQRHADDGRKPVDVGIERAARDSGAFSHRNAWIAHRDDTTVGMGFGYRLDDGPLDPEHLASLPENVVPFVRLEAEAPGSFYLNGLAVFPQWRRAGTGRLLMDYAFRRAREADCDRISLTMFAGNTRAAGLYRDMGFREIARRPPLRDPAHRQRGDILLLQTPARS